MRSTPSTGPARRSSMSGPVRAASFQDASRYQRPRLGVVADVVAHRLARADPRRPFGRGGGETPPARRSPDGCRIRSARAPGVLMRSWPSSSTRMVSLPPALPELPVGGQKHPRRIPRLRHCCSVISAASRWLRLRHNRLPSHRDRRATRGQRSPRRWPTATQHRQPAGLGEPLRRAAIATTPAPRSAVAGAGALKRGELAGTQCAPLLEHLHRGAQIRHLGAPTPASPAGTDPPPRG